MTAPWKALFRDHLSTLQSPEFALATIKQTPSGPLPMVRTCIFRGFWTELEHNPKNPASKNPSIYKSSCLTFTTDVRMDKVPDLLGSTKDVTKTGGGGQVEALYWIKDIQTQWRVSGRSYVLSEKDVESATNVKDALLKRMATSKKQTEIDWSWKGEIISHYGNLSPGMRGSFLHPAPGTPSGLARKDGQKQAQDQDPAPSDKLGNPIQEIDNPKDRENFRVVVIVPEVVEQTFLSSDPQKQRRWRYTLVNEPAEEWTTEELWP